MLSTLSEKKMHVARWAVFLAWGLLIVSLFYDPFSAALSDPVNGWSWLADDTIARSTDPALCVSAQGYCVSLVPYAIATRVFWGMVVPSAIFIVLALGHEFWRRICPLYFFSQVPRALGLKPLLNIEQNQWLQNNHLYVQFVLFFLGITARILITNSVRPVAGTFFILTLLSAAGMVALYGGRSWCHYMCPFGMVQTVFTGPRGLLDSQAHKAKPYSITQSMCRTVAVSGEESACISCKSACMDIDAEQAYWAQLHKPGRKLVQYGYLGLVIGYFCYYSLYAGNFEYYFSGVWSHESRAIVALLEPGFYVFGRAIAIPKVVAAPLTLATFAAASCWICTRIERYYRGFLKERFLEHEVSADMSLHRVFSVCTFIAFNVFFVYGGRPELRNFPVIVQFVFQMLIAAVSSLWLYRTWGRSEAKYRQESLAGKRRHQLNKMLVNVDDILAASTNVRKIEQLGEETVETLVKILPQLISLSQRADDQPQKGSAVPKTLIRHPKAQRTLPGEVSRTILR